MPSLLYLNLNRCHLTDEGSEKFSGNLNLMCSFYFLVIDNMVSCKYMFTSCMGLRFALHVSLLRTWGFEGVELGVQ